MYFKIAAVPFHQWTPDAYEGAPTSITAFISVAPKVASFAFIIRILFMGLWPLRLEWQALTIGVAIATMTLGNLAAITQSNIKRFFGYSTIAHVGYLLLGLVAAADGNGDGLMAIVIYLIVYAFMNLGAFAVIIMMRRKDIIGDEIDDLSGLMSRAHRRYGTADADISSLPGGNSSHGRLHRQVFHLSGARRDRALSFSGAGGWLRGCGVVLLFPHCCGDVFMKAAAR